MSLPEWNYLHGKPQHSARFKQQPEDFVVIEDMGFEPDGAGEHILVYVRKRSENTAWVAGLLAKAAGVQRSAVTWGGLKDRHAVTEQWFGIHVPGKDEPDLSSVESETIQILKRSRQDVIDCTVSLKAERADTDPKVFTRIAFHYTVTGRNLKPDSVERAIKLSYEKYCSATIMLGKTAEIEHTWEIVEA